MPVTYDNSSVYNKYASDCENCGGDSSDCSCGTSSDDCGCCPVGTIAVYDHCGKHLGCLTPNDADKFVNAKLEVPEGYVKVFHPTTGDYMGALPPAQAIELLNFLNGDGIVVVTDPTFNVVEPVADDSGYYEDNESAATGFSKFIDVIVDRVNMDETIMLSITGTSEDITFNPSGTILPMVSTASIITISFAWGITVTAGTHYFILRLTSSTVTRDIPVALILI